MKIDTINKAYKALVNIPAWQQRLLDGGDFSDSIDNVQNAYAKVPIVYRAVKMRCDALASVPVKITNIKTEKEADWPYPDVDIPDLVWKTEAALLGSGIAVILKLKNRVRTVGLQWLNPFTVTVSLQGQLEGAGRCLHQGIFIQR